MLRPSITKRLAMLCAPLQRLNAVVDQLLEELMDIFVTTAMDVVHRLPMDELKDAANNGPVCAAMTERRPHLAAHTHCCSWSLAALRQVEKLNLTPKFSAQAQRLRDVLRIRGAVVPSATEMPCVISSTPSASPASRGKHDKARAAAAGRPQL